MRYTIATDSEYVAHILIAVDTLLTDHDLHGATIEALSCIATEVSVLTGFPIGNASHQLDDSLSLYSDEMEDMARAAIRHYTSLLNLVLDYKKAQNLNHIDNAT